MNYIYIFLTGYGLKVFYDLSMWLYGYYLRIKWVSYFNSNNKNAIAYTYQIEKYLCAIPNEYIVDKIFSKYNQEEVMTSFIKAHGYYRHHFILNFWPFYWIKLLLFLPQSVIKYLGLNTRKQTPRLFNVIWWICGAIYTVYNVEIISYIKELISQLFSFFAK